VNIKSLNETAKTLSYITTNGVFEIYVFEGPTFKDVIKQYQNAVGLPATIPLSANGLISRSAAFTTDKNIKDAMNGYFTSGFPVDQISLPKQSMLNYTNL